MPADAAPPVDVPSGSQDQMPDASAAAGSEQVEVPTAGEASLPPTTPTTSESIAVPMAGEASLPEQIEVPTAGDAFLPPTTPTISGETVVDGPKGVEPAQGGCDTPASPVRADDADEELSALLMANVVSYQQSQFSKAKLVSHIFESQARLLF